MKKIHLERFAQTLWWGLKTARESVGGKYKPGDIVLVRFDKDAVELAEMVSRVLIEEGINTITEMLLTPNMERDYFQLSNDKQLKFLPTWKREIYRKINGVMGLYAPTSLTHLKNVDPNRMAMAAKKVKPLLKIKEKREAAGEFGWTLCCLPTKVEAKAAGMTFAQYEQQVIKACYLYKDNPVAVWQEMYENSNKIKDWLLSLDIKSLHVESENMDLKVFPGDQRKWLGLSGHNIPSFEIFTSPDYRKTEGVYYANTSSFRNGNYVKGVRFDFEKGKIVKMTAEEGGAFVRGQLDTDVGASRLGEFSLTDKRFSQITEYMANILYDENVGGENGNCHVAIGCSYPDTFNGNTSNLNKELKEKLGFNDSVIHWDLMNTEKKTVTAQLKTGEKHVIYDDGEFRY